MSTLAPSVLVGIRLQIGNTTAMLAQPISEQERASLLSRSQRVLRKVEWAQGGCCPVCRAPRRRRLLRSSHARGCTLASLLAQR